MLAPYGLQNEQTRFPFGAGFFMSKPSEKPVNIGETVWSIAKRRKSTYLLSVSKKAKTTHETTHERDTRTP